MRNDIIETARSYLGTRFRHQGRSSAGLDCVGLLAMIANKLGIDHKDQANYQRRTTGQAFTSELRRCGFVPKSLAERLPGDVLVFQELRQSCHVAVLADSPFGETLIHAFASRKAVVEEPYAAHWVDKTVGCYSFPGVD